MTQLKDNTGLQHVNTVMWLIDIQLDINVLPDV